MTDLPAFTLHDLAAIIAARADAGGELSYTRKLIDKGKLHVAKKLGEEAVELGLAAVAQERADVVAEAADLMFHFMVLLQVSGIALGEVEAALQQRTAVSGLEEKASRKRV